MKEKLHKALNKLGYTVILLLIFFLVKVLFRLEVSGRDNIPKTTDDLVITSTHTSYWDPPLIGLIFGPRRQIHFIARKGLLKNPLFSLPVKAYSTTINRDNFGKSDLIKMLEAFRSDGLLCIFPEGTTKEGAPPKSGTVRLAEKTNRKFLPVKIELDRSPLDPPFLFAPARMTIGEPVGFEDLKQAVRQESGGGLSDEADSELDYSELSLKLMERINQL